MVLEDEAAELVELFKVVRERVLPRTAFAYVDDHYDWDHEVGLDLEAEVVTHENKDESKGQATKGEDEVVAYSPFPVKLQTFENAPNSFDEILVFSKSILWNVWKKNYDKQRE